MKKVFCSFIVIILSFCLCCCKTENIKKERIEGEKLSDGTETYYINELNDNDQIIRAVRYMDNGEKIEELTYTYYYDINGRITKIKEFNELSGNYKETLYNKFRTKTEEIFYNKSNMIINKNDFLKNGIVKKSYIYENGKETGYNLYDYYSDNQLKNETEYSSDGKTVRITTYYKNKKLYQIKDFDKDGMIVKITKYSYKGDNLLKESIYDSEFNLYQVTDYSKNPPEIIKYKDGNPVNEKAAENS